MRKEKFTIRKATREDAAAISELLQTAKRENLPLDERIKVGYMQGDMSLSAVVQRFDSGFGALVAVENTTGEIVGVNFYSDAPTDTAVAHPLAGVAQTLQNLESSEETDVAGVPVTFANSMMYGHMAVADHAAGNGLARALIEGMLPITNARGAARIISFVDHANTASVTMHRRVGLHVLREYSFDGRPFSIFALTV